MLMIAFEIRRLSLETWVCGLVEAGARRVASGAAIVAGLVSLSACGGNPEVAAIARDVVNAQNLEVYDFVRASGGRIEYTLSNGTLVRFPLVNNLDLESAADCPRMDAAVTAIQAARFPAEMMVQDQALKGVGENVAIAADVADCGGYD